MNRTEYFFDYENQVWIVDGKYQNCGHPKDMICACFGRKHAGETAIITKDCH